MSPEFALQVKGVPVIKRKEKKKKQKRAATFVSVNEISKSIEV
jgi:hypothetical protein